MITIISRLSCVLNVVPCEVVSALNSSQVFSLLAFLRNPAGSLPDELNLLRRNSHSKQLGCFVRILC